MSYNSFYDAYLICVLDWGLGHATRCIPIINKLLQANKRVIIAGDGASLALLQHEFPNCTSYSLPPYNVSYSSDGNLIGGLIKQIPHFAKVRYNENKAVKDIVLKERVGYIISDNRYGCWNENCKNIFIGHHLKPVLIGYFRFFEWVAEWMMLILLSNFDEIWVPDEEGSILSGELSSLRIESKKYIGILSRIRPISTKEILYDVLIILSGPEPQRTALEKKLEEQISGITNRRIIMVCGIVGDIVEQKLNSCSKKVSWLDKEFLEDAISKSKLIVCRSGYSSIMDLAVCGKKALLIPTPGQTEQEYLATKLKAENVFLSVTQDELHLEKHIEEALQYKGFDKRYSSSELYIFNKIFEEQ